jgi:hypothetical protein
MNEVFASLQQKDSIRHKALFPDYLVFIEMMRKLSAAELKRDSLTIAALDSFADRYTQEQYVNEVLRGIVKKFNKTIKRGEVCGISWKDAKMERYELDSTGIIAGMVEMKADIFFTENGNNYKINCKSIIRYNNILYGVRFRKIWKLVDGKYTTITPNEEP